MWAAFNGDIAKVRAALKEPEVAVDGTDEVRHGGLVVTGESSLSQYICFPQDGSTPLTAAAWGGHLDIVKLLLENGANIEAVNNTVRADSVSSYAAAKPHAHQCSTDGTHLCLLHLVDMVTLSNIFFKNTPTH